MTHTPGPELPPLPPKWSQPDADGTIAFLFTGDHDAVEEWAAYLVTQHTGKEPDQAVFEGDCRGIYINPQRLAEIGINSTLTATAHIAHGESVKFENGEFRPVARYRCGPGGPTGEGIDINPDCPEHGAAADLDDTTVRDAALKLIRKGYFDPGATLAREFDQGPEKGTTEPVWAWGARAALANLVNAGLLPVAVPEQGQAGSTGGAPHEPDLCEHDETASDCQRCRMTAAEVMGGTLPDPSKGMGWTVELTETQRLSLPGVYHRPVFDGLSQPHAWICEVCWGDGWTQRWPCGPATEAGVELAQSLNVGWSW